IFAMTLPCSTTAPDRGAASVPPLMQKESGNQETVESKPAGAMPALKDRRTTDLAGSQPGGRPLSGPGFRSGCELGEPARRSEGKPLIIAGRREARQLPEPGYFFLRGAT